MHSFFGSSAPGTGGYPTTSFSGDTDGPDGVFHGRRPKLLGRSQRFRLCRRGKEALDSFDADEVTNER